MTREDAKKNKILTEDLPVHRWYQFVLGYPPHLVQYYVEKFDLTSRATVFDPFCGTGTTNVECLKKNITNYGLEANLLPCFASRVKTTLQLDVSLLRDYLSYIGQSLILSFERLNLSENLPLLPLPDSKKDPCLVSVIPSLSEEQQKILPKNFISEKPLQKVLVAKKIIATIQEPAIRAFFLLALANLIVNKAGNIAFGPEIYRTKPKADIDFLDYYAYNTLTMIDDLDMYSGSITAQASIMRGDSRDVRQYLPDSLLHSIQGIITSPPYPNEKDYTRSTRLESVLLDFVKTRKDLRSLKEYLLRSNSRNIFVNDHDGEHVARFERIGRIADQIEEKRLALHKTSGFEKMYHKIVRHYFGGMFLHFQSLKPFLAHGAKLAYVVGDQMSFFRIHIPTAELLAEIADYLGFKVIETELWRRRMATATKQQVDENVLILEHRKQG